MDVMAASSKQQNDFENRFFDMLQQKLNTLDKAWSRVERKLDANTILTREVKYQAEKTNGRVTKLEDEVFGKVKTTDMPPFWRDQKVMALLVNISLAILVLVIAATKVDVGVLLP